MQVAYRSTIQSNPKEAVSLCQEAIEKLDAYDHGSRFYNVKQVLEMDVPGSWLDLDTMKKL